MAAHRFGKTDHKTDDGYAHLPDEVREEGVDTSVSDEVGDVLAAALPWGISALAHAGMVLLAFFVVWSTIDPNPPGEVIVPIADFDPDAPIILNKALAPDKVRTSKPSRLSKLSELSTRNTDMLIGRGPSGESDATGSQGFAFAVVPVMAKPDPFGSSRQADMQLDVSFGGIRGNARNIVYCLDASGSLIDTMPFVVGELKRSIGDLSEQQKFAVIFFQDHDAVEVRQPKPGLKRATGETKKAVFSYIDPKAGHLVPSGATNPVNAVQLALRIKPDLIYLLSDNITGSGRWAVDQRQLLRAIDDANRSRTKINTIQFVYPDPLEAYGYKSTMQLIAEQHDGVYKFLDARELGLASRY